MFRYLEGVNVAERRRTGNLRQGVEHIAGKSRSGPLYCTGIHVLDVWRAANHRCSSHRGACERKMYDVVVKHSQTRSIISHVIEHSVIC